MSIYKELDITLQLISRSKEEYHYFKDLTLAHFEGKQVFNEMPDILKTTIIDWENAQIRGF